MTQQSRLEALMAAVGADVKDLTTKVAANTKQIPGGPTLTVGYLHLAVGEPVPSGTPSGTLILRG